MLLWERASSMAIIVGVKDSTEEDVYVLLSISHRDTAHWMNPLEIAHVCDEAGAIHTFKVEELEVLLIDSKRPSMVFDEAGVILGLHGRTEPSPYR